MAQRHLTIPEWKAAPEDDDTASVYLVRELQNAGDMCKQVVSAPDILNVKHTKYLFPVVSFPKISQ